MQEQAMLRERIVSLGRHDARGRIAYLLCELLWRHTAIGLAEGSSLRLLLTRTELGDTLGLTSVREQDSERVPQARPDRDGPQDVAPARRQWAPDDCGLQ